jgi:hypothetical protein
MKSWPNTRSGMAQLILAEHIQPGQGYCAKTINELLTVLDRNDVVEAVKRLKAGTGMRMVDRAKI